MIVHVTKKSGTRFEYTFPDEARDEEILAQLEHGKAVFGYNGTVKKKDAVGLLVDYADPDSGFAFDAPECVVAVVKSTGKYPREEAVLEAGKPVEVRRIKG